MYAVVFYDLDPGQADAAAHFARVASTYPRHRAHVDSFATCGDLVMIGTFGNPATEGSMAVFRGRDAAERFLADDPFVTDGLVTPRILDWDPLEFAADGTALNG